MARGVDAIEIGHRPTKGPYLILVQVRRCTCFMDTVALFAGLGMPTD
jgi:hypothetical protein